jgi:S-adenosylmethionine:tRNA ribosyltransferase-isomerase
MKLSDFDYTLPEELIAQTPLKERDQARLLVIDRKQQTIGHDIFSNLEKYLPPQSMLVVNNSKVIPARLLGKKKRSGGNVEIFLLDKLDSHSYRVMMRPCRKIKDGDEIVFDHSDVVATIVNKEERIVRFNKAHVTQHLKDIGHIPLPPYIKRQDNEDDRQYYQTVYARHAGSVAAPTAGLHFTKKLINQIKSAGHEFEQVMLHVNYATFKPVEEENILDHQMHTEEYSVSDKTFDAIKQAKKKMRKIVAVGTTSCRTLEAVARRQRLQDSTDLFLYPGCSFKMVDALITNFHLPKSTLLMLVYAFGGTDLMKKAYKEAIKQKYRFYSYGDGMIIK